MSFFPGLLNWASLTSKFWTCFIRLVSTLGEGTTLVRREMMCRITTLELITVDGSNPQVCWLQAELEPNVWLVDWDRLVGSIRAFALSAVMKTAWKPDCNIPPNGTGMLLEWWMDTRAVDNRKVLTVRCVLKFSVTNLLVGSKVSEFRRELFEDEEFLF